MSDSAEPSAPQPPRDGDKTRPTVPLHWPAGEPGLPPPEANLAAEGSAWPVVAGFQILEELGRGGMGVVYKARQNDLDRLVALKMILAGPHAGAEHLARFRTEARAIAHLRHPNIVQIFQVGVHESKPYLALELVEGGSLSSARPGQPWPAREAAAVVEKLARAMHAAHAKGFIHRDLKPGNVLLDADGEPKVTDFGLAKQLEAVDAAQTASNAVLGTPSYMAPEQTGGRNQEVGPPADVYALGAILYEMLTGRPPFEAETLLDTIRKVISDEPVPPRQVNPAVPRDLEIICLKCLAKKIDDRFLSAEALADDLRRFRDGEPITARPPGAVRLFSRWMAKNPGTAVAVFIALGLLLVPFVLEALFRIYFAVPVFAVVLLAFIRPTRMTLAVVAGALLILTLLTYWLFPHNWLWALILGHGLLPGVFVGTVGRVTVRVMKRDALATTLGAYFGFAVGTLLTCCGGPVIFVLSVGEDNMQKIQELNRQPDTTPEAIWELYQQFDYTWPIVLGAGWVLVAVVLPTVLGAVAGAASSGWKSAR